VTRDFQRDHGACPGGRSVVVGLGKLGSCEMTAASDLDLLLIYDFDDARSESAGPRALHAVQYYTRLTQRLVSALTVATRRGELYEVDMRLRPTGNKGPLATQFRAFVEYQTSEAEIWEQMALTRARVVCGDASLAGEVQRAIAAALSRPRDESVLKSEARDMRRLIAQEKGEENPWDLKLASGGLIDIEFIAQYLVLRHAGSHPKMLEASTARAIATAGELGLVARRDADRLVEAHALYGAVTQMLRLSIHGSFDPKAAAPGVLRRIASVAGFPDFRGLGRELAGTRKSVRAIFERLLA
jgi:glutamate-ammonia-ligase adenylyltransferase